MRSPRGPVVVLVIVAVATLLAPGRGSPLAATPLVPRPVAAVAWPISGSLVISEVQTGGTSASDEFVEIANVGPLTADLAGLEIAAASSAGTSASRRVGWSAPTTIDPGRHLLVANAAGVWASIADATYTTGLAATGGTVVLRPAGGAPIDAVGWGDATNAFVEGSPAPAPPAGSSVERRPGGDAGNGTDTNDGAADFMVRPIPAPQRLADPPTPAAPPSPTPSPSAVPSATPAPTSPPTPDPSATTVPTPAATTTPVPTDPATPAPSATPAPTDAPTPAPTVAPTPSPTPPPAPTPSPIAISEARSLADGAPALVEGVLTTDLGDLDADHTGFVQDGTGGIALYLDDAAPHAVPAGTVVRAACLVGTRYGLAVLRCTLAGIEIRGSSSLPEAVRIATGAADARFEGVRVAVAGRVTDAPTALADGTAFVVDDGSGQVRVIVDTDLAASVGAGRGSDVVAVGPLGRRDLGGAAAFRVHATLAGSFAITPGSSPTPSPSGTPGPSLAPTPTPEASPSASPHATPAPSPTPTPSPTATPAPTQTPSAEPVVAIASALASPAGRRVRVRGVVTSVPGTLWSPRLGTIQDATGSLVVRYRGDDHGLAVGARVEATGTLLRSGGRLVLRADDPWVASGAGADVLPAPTPIDPGPKIDAATDARLVRAAGTVARGTVRRNGARLTFDLVTAAGVRFGVTATADVAVPSTPVAGDAVEATGVGVPGVSGTRTAAGRVWLRKPDDLRLAPAGSILPAPTDPTGSSGAESDGEGSPAAVPIARLVAGARVTIGGVVSVGPGILAPRGRAFRVEDGSGSVEVLAAVAGAAATAPPAGTRVTISGRVERLARGLRVRAASIVAMGTGTVPIRLLRAPPSATHLGSVVRVAGAVTRITRAATSWRAEVAVGGRHALVAATAASGPAPAGLVVGARVTVTGLVVSAPASAADRRPRIVPRGPGDVVVGPVAGAAGATVASAAARTASAAVAVGSTTSGGGGGAAASGATTTGGNTATAGGGDPVALAPLRSSRDLAAAATGTSVRVGGVVRGATSGVLLVEDADGVVRLRLVEAAAPLSATARAGDAVAASGTTGHGTDGTVEVRVTDPAAVTLLAGPAPAAAATVGEVEGDGAGPLAGGASAEDPDASADPVASAPATLGDVRADALRGVGASGSDGGPVPLVPLVAGLLVSALAACAVVLHRRLRVGPLEPAVARRLAALRAVPPPGPRPMTRPAGSPHGLHSAPRLDARLAGGLSSPPTRAEQARPR